jgi:RimJ/RimL family protein N-acetyltransferase
VPDLQTTRLFLRSWKDTDREPFYRINSDPRVMEFFPACLTFEESDATIAHIEAHFEKYGYGAFAAELRSTGELIGFVGLWNTPFEASFTPCVEIGWRLSANHWNEGLATEAADAVLRLGFEELGLREILAFTVPANMRSRRVMEKLGMNYVTEFDHPQLPQGHPLRRHVLYRKRP